MTKNTLFAIEWFVGRKFGMWARGLERFASADEGLIELARVKAGETKAGACHLTGRVVAVR